MADIGLQATSSAFFFAPHSAASNVPITRRKSHQAATNLKSLLLLEETAIKIRGKKLPAILQNYRIMLLCFEYFVCVCVRV